MSGADDFLMMQLIKKVVEEAQKDPKNMEIDHFTLKAPKIIYLIGAIGFLASCGVIVAMYFFGLAGNETEVWWVVALFGVFALLSLWILAYAVRVQTIVADCIIVHQPFIGTRRMLRFLDITEVKYKEQGFAKQMEIYAGVNKDKKKFVNVEFGAGRMLKCLKANDIPIDYQISVPRDSLYK